MFLRAASVLLLASLSGCPKQPAAPSGPEWDTTPRLPAPLAGSYTRVEEVPPDPALAAFLKGRRWDAALSGAAAGLALQLVNEPAGGPGLTRWRVREALWKAGYPFPVADARAWVAVDEVGSPPPPLTEWLAAFPEGDDLGLVRARGNENVVWIGLRATPTANVGRIPRQLPEGGSFTIPANPGARWMVSDANGELLHGELDAPATVECNSVGEWMVEIVPATGASALFPVYVGMVPPELALIRTVTAVRTPADALHRAETLLREVRDAYGSTALQRDFVLDAGARSLLRGDAGSADGVRTSLGLDPAGTMLFQCSGTTVEACIDTVVWKPENRLALLDDQSALGLAADVDGSGVQLVGIVSVTH
ncbi:MAG: hypothetical protein R3F61_18185 [Myxococcota bacterium]